MYNANKLLKRQEAPRATIGSGLKTIFGFIAAAVMLGAIVFPAKALGHDIDVNLARKSLHWYSVAVAQNENYYQNPDITCKKMFPHQVRCRVSYKTHHKHPEAQLLRGHNRLFHIPHGFSQRLDVLRDSRKPCSKMRIRAFNRPPALKEAAFGRAGSRNKSTAIPTDETGGARNPE